MATKEFIIQVRYTVDHPNQFKAAVKIMQQSAASIFTLLRIAAGPGQPDPDIKVYSDDTMELIKTEEDARKHSLED